jgi:hypothetical protein
LLLEGLFNCELVNRARARAKITKIETKSIKQKDIKERLPIVRQPLRLGCGRI